ncbi:zinc finger BED domain-containing protein RICESLEEPER 2-like [Canna indica]|uniref:Zinc finger BED domain-containing protein RICESLEEPER 2-like n=1 Tax=Canna indica TaxID=4628 RepID=A0AAQ3Q951_9LILI|nr:zinc finger BED domain-containing protein RICESLEEPER 2-like [Canna indica]
MIVKDEYPFSCVDGEGFRDFCATGMPRFQIPSRQTVSRDCYELYVAERLNLKKLLQLECQPRLQRFKTCVEKEKIESKALLRLDVPTRWNSTYQTLEVALRFERAFERCHEEDPCFERDLLEGDGRGRPIDFDWVILKGLVQMLQIFYRVTLTVSGTISTTSNVYLHDISEIAALLNEWVFDRSLCPEFREMVVKMKEK